MTIIRVETGDLIQKFETKQYFGIAHGCNCFHYMHAGIAGQLAKRYETVREADKKTKVGDPDKLGTMSVARTDFGWVYNMYTQFNPGREDQAKLEDNIWKAFMALDVISGMRLDLLGVTTLVGIPMIGAGIAGGDWKRIQKVIDDATPNTDIVLVEYKPEPSLLDVAQILGFIGGQ